MRARSVPVLAVAQTLCMAAFGADYPSFDSTYTDSSIDLSMFTQVWADEFDLLRVSQPGRGTGPWFTGGHAVLARGEKMAITLPDPAYTLSAGILSMSTRLDPVDGKRVEAHLQTDDRKGNVFEFQNGYLEARMWVPKALGSHGGLWLLSRERPFGHVEVDVVETYGHDDYAVHSTTHMWPVVGSAHAYTSKRVVKRDIFDGFHLYGVLATDSYFAFYYDGKELARIARLPEQRVPLYLLLSLFGNPAQPVIEPATMKVDYIRLYVPKTPKAPVIR